jgi:hypothetical protein
MKRGTRLVLLVAALGAGFFIFDAGGEDVVLVYDLAQAPDASGLEVEIRRGDALLRRATFRVGRGEEVRHRVKLPRGEYALAWRVSGPRGGGSGGRRIVVEEAGTIVLPLAP